jgi:hypothetical protein
MSGETHSNAVTAAPPDDDVIELDEAQVVRPEHFFLPGVCGLSVARRISRNGKAESDWALYLQRGDGRREMQPLPDTLEVSGQRLFVSPRPGPVGRAGSARWSAESRNDWLAGRPSMAPEELCRLLLETLARYIDMPTEVAPGSFMTLACWVVLTYVAPVFDAVPYLLLNGPAGSGKSRLIDLLAEVVFRPLVTSNLSHAALFRSLDIYGGTALLDEAERLRESNAPDVQELLSSLLSGYRKGGTALRCEGDRNGAFQLRHFSVFGPKAFACINEVPHTLASRCIPVQMQRSPAGSEKHRRRFASEKARFQAIRDALHCAALSFGAEWLTLPVRNDICPEVCGRNYELWQPIFAVAAWFEDHGVTGMLPELRQHAARCISGSKESGISPEDEAILQAVAATVRTGRLKTAGEVLAAVQSQEPALFRHWSARRIANRLRNYGLKSRPSQGRQIFDPSLSDLLRIQDSYGFRLGVCSSPTPGNVHSSTPRTPGPEDAVDIVDLSGHSLKEASRVL